MKVLVTGAGGYIGSVLVPTLLQDGFEVIAFDRFLFGKETLQEQRNLTILEGDIRSVEDSLLKEVYGIIDLAALANDPKKILDPSNTHSINYQGRASLAKKAKDAGVQRYIFPSTCSIYGYQDNVVNEESKVNPLTEYAIANYQAEQEILPLADSRFIVTILRQATVYGLSPRMRFDLLINQMVKGIHKTGKVPIAGLGAHWRPFVHVRDTSRAMSMILKADKELVNKGLFNVGSNEQNYQILSLGEKIASALNLQFEKESYEDPDTRSYKVDFSKIKKALGFKPLHNAETGAVEIWDAIKGGSLDPDDPKTLTLQWYQNLIRQGVRI